MSKKVVSLDDYRKTKLTGEVSGNIDTSGKVDFNDFFWQHPSEMDTFTFTMIGGEEMDMDIGEDTITISPKIEPSEDEL